MKINIFPPASAIMLLTAAIVTGCHDDNGNYSYTDLDTVVISCNGNESNDVFTLGRGDRLQITPEIKFNGHTVSDNSDTPLSYMWTFYSASTGSGIDYTVDTIATTRQLDAIINRSAGTYYAQLTVTNVNTGIESYYRATCNIEETITAGWMLIYERADMPGHSDVGLVVNPFSKKNIQSNKEFWNLYSSSNGGQPLPGEPVSIFHETIPLASGGTPRMATTKTISVVSTANFSKVFDWTDMFFEAPEADNISWYGSCSKMGCCEGLIMDNQMRILTGQPTTGIGYFGLPKRLSTDIGTLAPWASSRCNGNAVLESVVYSQTNGAFYYTNTSLDFRPFVPQDPSASRFDINDTGGAQLLFGDWGTAYHDFLLFGIGDSRYIAEANFSASPALPNIGLTWADVSSAPHITEATAFATNFIGRYAYYGAADKVYNIAYDNGRTSVAWTAPDTNEVVTCISTHKFYFTTIHAMMMPNANNVVHIATWNPVTSQGNLYEYRINPASGEIFTDGENYRYTVPGKVKDMCWKYEMAM